MHKHRPDLVVLDVMLPRLDGFEVLREIRKTGKLPVIMLTARGEVSDRWWVWNSVPTTTS